MDPQKPFRGERTRAPFLVSETSRRRGAPRDLKKSSNKLAPRPTSCYLERCSSQAVSRGMSKGALFGLQDEPQKGHPLRFQEGIAEAHAQANLLLLGRCSSEAVARRANKGAFWSPRRAAERAPFDVSKRDPRSSRTGQPPATWNVVPQKLSHGE